MTRRGSRPVAATGERPDTTAYHLCELQIARDPSAPGHLLPPIPPGCRAVLDVGCGAGQTLIGCGLPEDVIACGIDPDVGALALGRRLTDAVRFTAAAAERLPFPDASFDLVLSRVALPYTNIPEALSEAARVLRAGGDVWLCLHGPRMALRTIRQAVRARSARGAIYGAFVLMNGVLLHLSGRQFRWPVGRRRFESVQTMGGIRRALHRAGFERVSRVPGRFFVVTAKRA